MTLSLSDTVNDAALNYLKNNVTQLVLLDAHTTTFSDTQSDVSSGGRRVASVTVTSTDFTVGAGDTDGREIASAVKNAVTVTTTGPTDGTHLAWVDVSGSEVLYVTQLSPIREDLSSGDTVNIPSTELTYRAPTAEA